MFFAHSTARADKADWEPYAEHWREVARLASARAAKFGAETAAGIASEFHDLGKLTRAYQDYIAGGARQGPDHSTAGARELLALAQDREDRLIAELLAYAIAGHHAGLPDKTGQSDGTLTERLAREDLPALDPAWRAEHSQNPSRLRPPSFKPEGSEAAFQLAFLGRMIFSCLVDADFLATEAFYAAREGKPVDRAWPPLPDIIDGSIAALGRYRAELGKSGTEPQLLAIRATSFAAAVAQAEADPGVFTLDLPTGAGKTLTSLGFALHHAKAKRMQRIIYAIPFTSVIDQTAGIFRSILGEDVVLEHHSALDASARPEEGEPYDPQSAEAKRRRAAENWDAPVVVTTNVQLFESLFAHRTSRCRKLHNIARSVIILDECQTVPLHVLRPVIAALRELCRTYGCSLVLCTATQPALAAPRFRGGFVDPQPLIADSARLHAALRRVTPRLRGELTDAALVLELGQAPQGLVIVNSRGHALALYRAAKDTLGAAGLVHLTTRQTAADRRSILARLKEDLRAGRPCRVIATSLIEAGIDISFPVAWRAEAGLDQIIQAAGRVNREGCAEAAFSIVHIFRPAEAGMPPEIKAFGDAMRRVAEAHGADLFAPAAIQAYFEQVYWEKDQALDRTMMPGPTGTQPQAVMDQFRVGGGKTDFAYRTVGESFRLIKDGMAPVIIKNDVTAKEILAELDSGRLPPGAAARRLQTFIVQVPPFYRRLLLDNKHATFVAGFDDRFCVLQRDDLYTPEMGLVWERADEVELTHSII
jgi:CRISPR-associated endonuclease/helicase Cas3